MKRLRLFILFAFAFFVGFQSDKAQAQSCGISNVWRLYSGSGAINFHIPCVTSSISNIIADLNANFPTGHYVVENTIEVIAGEVYIGVHACTFSVQPANCNGFTADASEEWVANTSLVCFSGQDASQTGVSPCTPATYNPKALGGAKPACDCATPAPGDPSRPGGAQIAYPVDIGTGNVSYGVTDYETAGANKLSFVRYYNSFINSATFAGNLGITWRSNYDRYLSIGASGVVAERPDGRLLSFTQSGTAWASDSDVDMTLTQSGSGTGSQWSLADGDDTVETYTQTSANEATLNQIRQRNGYAQTVTYNSSYLPISVTDSYGRMLTLTYSGNKLTSVGTPEGTTISFAYTSIYDNAFQLQGANYSASGGSVQYVYGNPNVAHAMTAVIDENSETYLTWTYDASGRGLTSQIGAGANLVSISYNDADGSRSVTNALGVIDVYRFSQMQGVPKLSSITRKGTSTTAASNESFTYDNNGYLAGVTDWDGNVTHTTNNSHGLPTEIDEAVGSSVARTTTIAYDSIWVHLPATITAPGLTTRFVYDASGQELTKTVADTTATTKPYAASGQVRTFTKTWSNYLLASAQTPNGNTTSYSYDGTGALVSTTDPLGHTTQITSHTGGGLPKTIVDPNGVTTTITYDSRQRPTSSTINGSTGTFTTTWYYDAAGNIVQTSLPDNSFFLYAYDTAHRLTQVTDGLRNYTSYTLDGLGDRTKSSIYKNGGILTATSSATYDALGRELVDTGGAGQTTTRTYDPNGNVLTVTDGLNHTTANSYDGLNRQTASTDANNGITTTTYDTHDRTLSVTDANGNQTSYIRSGFGDVIEQISPDSGVSVFHYDADANLTSKTDALGIVTNQTFDALDRPLTTTYPAHASENVAYTYDQTGAGFSFGIGRLTSVTDAVGSLAKTYEERGNLASEIRVNGGTTLTTRYTYDGASRIASMTYPDGSLITYQHDAAGYVSAVNALLPGASAVTPIANLTHQPFGPLNEVTYGNRIAETWAFDASYRPITITDLLSGSKLQNLTYSYDLADNVSSIADAVSPANSQALGYDVLNRLTSATSGAGGYGNFTWIYDNVGNRLTQIQGTTTTAYGYTPGTNRLASISTSMSANAQKAHAALQPQNHGSNPHRATRATRLANPVEIGPAPMRSANPILMGALGWPMVFVGIGGMAVFRKRMQHNRQFAILPLLPLLTGGITLLIGCGVRPPTSGVDSSAGRATVFGNVHGGQQPISGATIQLYAAGTAGDGSKALPLLTGTVVTNQNGNFTFSSFTCPSPQVEVYLTATGGNPGLTTATNNQAIAEMAAIGSCGSIGASTFVSVNELTTVASLAALYPYMSSYSSLGSGMSDSAQLTAAFNQVAEYVNTATGRVPGPSLPSGYYASSTEINTLADIIASCINSSGGTAGDGTTCGTLLSLAGGSGGSAPTDTIGAILNILNNPTLNIAALFNLAGASAPFQPTLTSPPTDWTLPILAIPATPVFSLAGGTYSAARSVSLSDATAGATIYYTTDGTAPVLTSKQYKNAITVASSETIQAVAVVAGRAFSPTTSASYSLSIPTGIMIATNANGNITSIPPANSAAVATFAYNNANRLASVTGSPIAATFAYDYQGQRYSKTDGGTPAIFYSYMQGQTLIAENDNGVVTDYVYVDGRPIATLQSTANPAASQINYIIADRLGTPQLAVNSVGTKTWGTTYQPFGTTGDIAAFVIQNLRLPGQYVDTETGFSYNLQRNYMPNVGRYLETDPAGLIGGIDGYSYVEQNPPSNRDRNGTRCEGFFKLNCAAEQLIQDSNSSSSSQSVSDLAAQDIRTYNAGAQQLQLVSRAADAGAFELLSPPPSTLTEGTGFIIQTIAVNQAKKLSVCPLPVSSLAKSGAK